LVTAYKLLGRIVATRLQEGLGPGLRGTPYGLRPGRSTTEPIFIVRRLQDLVIGRQHQALHMICLGWEKVLDKVDTGCLSTVLSGYWVPEKVKTVVLALTGAPEFRVAMNGHVSGARRQRTGMRQGCTLSPFLFTLTLSAIMHDVETRVRTEHPLAITPAVPTLHLDFADDTVLMGKTAETVEAELASTEEIAASCAMKPNRAKVKLLAHGTDDPVKYADGNPEKVEYLGVIIHENGEVGPEIRSRTASTHSGHSGEHQDSSQQRPSR